MVEMLIVCFPTTHCTYETICMINSRLVQQTRDCDHTRFTYTLSIRRCIARPSLVITGRSNERTVV